MVCTTVKLGMECFFMSKKGCKFNGGSCHQIIEKCEGCQKIKEFPAGRYCLSFPEPATKWKAGICSMATHVKAANEKTVEKLNPIKASKRGAH
ncbi:MAG: PxxKW family cysteine-rich protein [Pseudomonadota bacterium]